MCFVPKAPRMQPLAVADPNAGLQAAEEERNRRAKAGGFAATLVSTAASRKTGTAASKLLFGE
jgi:predicted TIM-barrel fold metal-dependent hydrolase